MATKDDLLNEIQENYSVISLEDKGTTAGGKVREYDLWYDDNGIIRYKRLHIFEDNKGNAKWYGENPIPQPPKPTETFDIKVKNKAKTVLSENKDIKHIKIDDIDSILERATATIYIDESGVVKEKKAAFYKDSDGNIVFEILG